MQELNLPSGWMELKYTNHALDRIHEREKGSLICYPSSINVLESNILSTEVEDGKITQFKYKIPFKKCEMMVLVIRKGTYTPDKWLVTTVYFKKIRK